MRPAAVSFPHIARGPLTDPGTRDAAGRMEAPSGGAQTRAHLDEPTSQRCAPPASIAGVRGGGGFSSRSLLINSQGSRQIAKARPPQGVPRARVLLPNRCEQAAFGRIELSQIPTLSARSDLHSSARLLCASTAERPRVAPARQRQL